MTLVCGSCGGNFESKTSRAKYCKDSCRAKAHRSKNGAAPILRPVSTSAPDQVVADGIVSVVESTLINAGRLNTPMGQLCMVLARQINSGAESAAGMSSLSKELSARLGEALAGAEQAGDIVDELRAKRALRAAR